MLDRIILFPYYSALKIRNVLYDKGVLKSKPAAVPTICVGNVTVGGTGKTPHTEMLLRMLLDTNEWGGKNMAVLSRGYKRKSRGFYLVSHSGNASVFGDEPLQIKKKFPQVTVAVDSDRARGCDFLVHPEKTAQLAKKRHIPDFLPSDLIILDDAYQHRSLKCNFNIVLVDYNRPVTSDSLLPFGRLRDLPERIYDADALIVTKSPNLFDGERDEFVRNLGLTGYDIASCSAVTPSGKTLPVFFTGISYCAGVPVYECNNPRYLYSHKVIMCTGIAGDKLLRNYLSDTYKIVAHFNFPDHHGFTVSDVRRITEAIKKNPTAAVVTTEKDAQRLVDLTGMPEIIKERIFIVPITVDFLSDNEHNVFLGMLRKI